MLVVVGLCSDNSRWPHHRTGITTGVVAIPARATLSGGESTKRKSQTLLECSRAGPQGLGHWTVAVLAAPVHISQGTLHHLTHVKLW